MPLDTPKAIIEAARDPHIPAHVVIAAAQAVSRSGRLVEHVRQEIAKRGGFFE
jgi:hypothetical protein